MIQCAAHFPTTVFSSSVEDFPTNFYLSWHCVWSLTRPRNSIDRNIRNYLDRVRKSINCMKNKNSKIWWNLILWITSLPSKWPKVFSQKLIWIGEYCGSRLIFKMRSEDTLLEKWCISLRFHSVTRQHFSKLENAQLVSKAIKADHEVAEHFVCHRGPSTNHRRDEWFRKYADWLRSINHAIWYGGYHV